MNEQLSEKSGNLTAAIASLEGGLIVSCQAPPDSPLAEPSIIAAIALASVRNGAVGVRIDTPAHVQAVRDRLGATIPIIGLWKQSIPGSEVYITPQFHHAEAIAASGADIIAIDATDRTRPHDETLSNLIAAIHTRLGKPVMADVDTLESAIAAANFGADIIGTTLYGYTRATQDSIPPGFDLLAEIRKTIQGFLICEGGISSPEMAKRALNLGANAVVVGTDITGIDLKVQAYQKHLNLSD
ncbi:N-acetylmannosamine-6-phosphate 2-epimerase [Laspinema olomoucense]|uniref:N-acetylmannosamine-6-phosphate 2-epimerase n=1 Tax=Laspinema olomoucense TaxID=3231600 RepID=UPI0021BBA969|nr:N-acetylmannosamine-6-phosphate 2-epimerase [Laspinema sp. D3c]MCT7992346.1 N-acetylmannosamine-6-phosphate 2-epimerase [Laspinema sp. D3c]